LYTASIVPLEDYKFCFKDEDSSNLDNFEFTKCNICDRLCYDNIDFDEFKKKLKCKVSDEMDFEDEDEEEEDEEKKKKKAKKSR